MKKIKYFVLPILLACFLVSCATLKDNWNKATEDEKARIILFGFQKSLKSSLELGVAYVNLHPEKKAEWQTKIIPMFDATNKILFDLETQGAAGKKLTIISVSLAVVGRIAAIETILTGWGVKLSFTSDDVVKTVNLFEGRDLI